MIALALALVIPWAAGIVLALLDGRRPVVGWLAVAVLAANLAALVVLAAQVLPDGRIEATTGDWPASVSRCAPTRSASCSPSCRRSRCSPQRSTRCSTACASASSRAWSCYSPPA